MDRIDTFDRETLLEAARRAALQAYAPYSRFRVGAVVAVECEDGPALISGANVENASYGLTLCAERSALAAACALESAARAGSPDEHVAMSPKITHVAVACIDAPSTASPEERMPCGACRQWLAELAPDAVYYVDGVERALHLDDILPHPFHLRR